MICITTGGETMARICSVVYINQGSHSGAEIVDATISKIGRCECKVDQLSV